MSAAPKVKLEERVAARLRAADAQALRMSRTVRGGRE